MNKIPFIIFIGLIAFFAVVFFQGKDPAVIESVMIGRDAPVFDLPSAIEGGSGFSSKDLKGEVSLVNIFASWCLACKVEHSMLKKIANAEHVAIYGVDYKDKANDLKKWLDKHGNIYKAIGADSDGRVAIDWGVYGVPETFIVDREGVIRYKHVGPVTAEVYNETFKPLLEILKK